MAPPREIWILRHAEAAPTGPEGDASRPLTAGGRKRALEVGRVLEGRGLRPARILASPYLRARDTASLVGASAARDVEVEEDGRLEPGGDPEGLAREALREGPLPALLVGHNPDLGDLVLSLSGAPVAMRKGMLVRVAIEGKKGRIVEVL